MENFNKDQSVIREEIPLSKPLVSVIILGYNGLRFVDDCLRSVLDQDIIHRYEVIYIDNDSTDGSGDYVRANFSQVKTISFDKNLGFAQGNNEAIQYTNGRYLVFLNQDMGVDDRLNRRNFIRLNSDPAVVYGVST